MPELFTKTYDVPDDAIITPDNYRLLRDKRIKNRIELQNQIGNFINCRVVDYKNEAAYQLPSKILRVGEKEGIISVTFSLVTPEDYHDIVPVEYDLKDFYLNPVGFLFCKEEVEDSRLDASKPNEGYFLTPKVQKDAFNELLLEKLVTV